jgi:glycosyltransferase involved in cell wall biosynthesis
MEHIVSDGGSNDNTLDILKEFEGTYHLNWISEPDNGIADALNKGIKRSRGRYIIVIQADDRFLNTGILDNVYHLLNKEQIDVCSFPVIFENHENDKTLKKPIKFLWWNHFKFIFLHQGCFVHRRVFERIGGFRKEFKICMDYDFFYRALVGHLSVKFGNFPVALMGGAGVGSDSNFIYRRLAEERLVQLHNEKNYGWKTAQFIFRLLYMQYKKYRIGLRAAK